MTARTAVEPRSSMIHRPLVKLSAYTLLVYELIIGLELILWQPFRVDAVFQPARARTLALTQALHMHTLDIWGIGYLVSGALLWMIFTDRWWKLGWFGAALGAVETFFLSVSFFLAVGNPQRSATTGHPLPANDRPGLFVATTTAFLAVELLEIVTATLAEHRRAAETC